MALCEPCRIWLSLVLTDVWTALESSSHLLEPPPHNKNWHYFDEDDNDEDTGAVVLSRSVHHRDRSEFFLGLPFCWICCRIAIAGGYVRHGAIRALTDSDGDENDALRRLGGDISLKSELVMQRVSKRSPAELDLLIRGQGDWGLRLTIAKKAENRPGELWTYHLAVRKLAFGESMIIVPGTSVQPTLRTAVNALTQRQQASISSDPARIAMIKSCLSACIESHPKCQNQGLDGVNGNRAEVPTRLIKLGTSDLDVKLVYANDEAQPPLKYVALSHCWGSEKFLTLTNSNLDRFLTQIPVSELELTFRQAILLCRSLDFAYLWIDCLCIIQDNEDDWKHEALRMDQIYSNATLTIAASASSAPSEGISRLLLEELLHDAQFEFPNGMVLFENMFELQRLAQADYEASPGLRRGWILQELILSPRVIYWTGSQLIWRCNSGIESEFFNKIDSSVYLKMWQGVFNDLACDADSRWATIASNYVQTKVTKSRDRYYAIAGMAAQVSRLYIKEGITTKYVAGCWTHNLPKWLAWIRRTQKVDALKPQAFNTPDLYCPSWSWLRGEDQEIQFPIVEDKALFKFGPEQSVAKVLEVSCDLVGPESMFGPLKSANLELKAPVFEFSDDGGCIWNGNKDKARPDGEISFRSSKPGAFQLLWRKDDDPTSNVYCTTDDGILPENPVKCALLWYGDVTYERAMQRVFALILKPVRQASRLTYERLGLLVANAHKKRIPGSQNLETFLKIENLEYESITLV